jgi:flagellar motor switch/type III secretory pathway protein FliN
MTEIVPLRARGLPRVSARDAAAARAAARLVARLPPRAELALAGFGTVTLTCEGAAAPEGAAEAVAFGLSRGRGAGRLVLDGALAHRIVALALGGPARVPAVGPLGLGERGIVAGFVASLLHALEVPLAVSLATASRSEDAVALALAVTVGGTIGWASLEIPAVWLADASPDAERLGPLPLTARLVVARTLLTAGELAGLVPGDAVVFDGEPRFDLASGASASGAARFVYVMIGVHEAVARLAADGRVELTGDFRRVRAPGDRTSSEEIIMDGRASGEQTDGGTVGAGVDVTAVLAAAPIEVVAELGRLTLRGDEVVGLGPGSVLPFGATTARAVALRVGEEIWAEGELVDVDGELGVRVTAIVHAGLRAR